MLSPKKIKRKPKYENLGKMVKITFMGINNLKTNYKQSVDAINELANSGIDVSNMSFKEIAVEYLAAEGCVNR